MPTGYTAGVNDGSVTTLRDYALTCARAFGALIDLRDEPADAPIPDKFEAHTSYHDEALAEATARLAELQAMTDEQIQAATDKANAEGLAKHEQDVAGAEVLRQRYEAMLRQAETWKAPTPDHAEFKKFMVSQLEQSIEFDCRTFLETFEPVRPAKWYADAIKDATWSIEYHTKERAGEIARAAERTAWVEALRDSLPVEEGAAQ